MIDRHAITEARRVLGRQLAELRKAAGYSQHEFAPLTWYARGTLANVEIGRLNVQREFWQRCDEQLGTDGTLTRSFDELDALIRRRHEQAAQQAADEVADQVTPDSSQQQGNHGASTVTWDPMRRRTLFAWGLSTTAATGLGAGSGAVGSADVARLQSVEARLYRLAAQHGGQMLWQAAADSAGEGHLMLERGSYSSNVGRQLLTVTGRLQICAGWLAFDAGRHEVAQACNEEALKLARQAGDSEVESQALADLARGSYVLDRPREAERLASTAGDVAMSAGVSARLAVIPQLRRAVASSLLADARGSAQAIRQARTTLDRERDEPVEEWCAFVTPFEIDGIEAACALELGHAARAQRQLENVVAGHEPRFRRNRALYQSLLAQARLDNSEVDGAAEAAHAVLDDLAGDLTSWKVNSELGTVARRLAEYPRVDGVGQFLDRYRAVGA